MKNKLVVSLIALASFALFSSCEKGGGDFSILSESSQFQQASTFVPRKLDVLFVVDNSGSMSSSQTNLANNFPSFINYFKSKGYDFRIAVTTTDAFYGDQFVSSGCSLCNISQTEFRGTPKFVDNNTPDLEATFAANVQVGTTGAPDERAFSSFKAALGSSLNATFHRPDAFLSVIIVSDEEDFSHDDISQNESYSQPTLHSAASYKTFLETFTAGQATSDFSVSTISILDETCRASLGSGRKIGVRYMELADLTGGTKNSLCTSFATILDNISTSIATQTQAQFQLNKKPVIESIRVIIDGVLVPESTVDGWSYDSVSNSIKINGSTYQPSAGSSITINFDPDIT
ncbi:MAG: hypothetical protein A2622_01320 [Bdellovibrionales bacterium RIFCSPHIGHO2_01_FULL_40_29]|nr:MAG: hypothetical protein A2622_01320 [Bdellovibrionales bacterium RIFCSPHIGHO2_01_FULL_40_29]OFZ32747.1 MAG: hypothetical protein A3D17_05920 [Bdellovibrionales bacterium RIFCSPHIGHO2_02_FULL_40_15]